MTIYGKINDKKLKHDIKNYEHQQQVKLINMNILQAKKYCHMIKVE